MRNKTLSLTESEYKQYQKRLVKESDSLKLENILNKTINADLFNIINKLPQQCVDLLIIDPPYNMNKTFDGNKFTKRDSEAYTEYIESWLPSILETVKHDGSVYMCGDWRSSVVMYQVLEKYLTVRNRITWQREKGRGAAQNWKNSHEDIWFGTMSGVSDDYYFNVDAVKQKRRVIAPYKIDGVPKDWEETVDGNFRLTYPSNLWDDITVPFWSMSENTDHSTQKPEKLIAKLILASSKEGGVVLDPFLGSGTTSVVAKKLGRHYIGIEISEKYCCVCEKRLEIAEDNKSIQGYLDGVFYERNSSNITKW